MNRVNLEKIEADVVLVGINEDAGTVHIQPTWECDVKPEDLWGMAATFGLWCAEQDGCGQVRVEVYDFRPTV